MLEPATLRFLKGLKKNNHREWFESHRTAYEAARIDFSNFLFLVIRDLGGSDLTIAGLQPKDCLFRLNRDTRFSKDKTPYKTNFGASIKRGGKKSPFAGYYFHLEPGASFIGGGLWMPEAPSVKAVRQEIDYNSDEFNRILGAPPFRAHYNGLYSGEEAALKTMPKGYEKDHPMAPYLKLKSFIAETRVSDEELTGGGLHKKTVSAFEALQPLLQFINRSLGEAPSDN